MRLRVLFLTLHFCIARGRPHALGFCWSVYLLDAEFRFLFPFCFATRIALLNEVSLLAAVYSLSAECGRLC